MPELSTLASPERRPGLLVLQPRVRRLPAADCARRGVSVGSRSERSMTPSKRVVVAGIGGTIGSHFVEHLARMPEIRSLSLIDRDCYEPRNRINQSGVTRGPKAAVQARRVRHLNPGLEVIAQMADVERLPLGQFRADLLVSCVDNRRARLHLNQVSRWLGVPWIDAGVLADGGYARVTRFGAEPSGPCLTCGWGPRDYQLVEQRYPCQKGDGIVVPATGASSALGALAAALLALECQRVLRGDDVAADRPMDFVVASDRWQAAATRWVRNPGCLSEHSIRPIDPLRIPLGVDIAEAAAEFAPFGGRPAKTLAVVGGRFAHQLLCRRCGPTVGAPRLIRTGEASLRCPGCRRPAAVVGFGLEADLDLTAVANVPQPTTIGALGCLPGDVIALSADSVVRYLEVSQ